MNENKYISIDDMRDLIERKRSQEVWRLIEQLPNWQDRIVNRFLFFKAGGQLE